MRLGIVGAGMIVRGLFTFIHEVEGIELEAIASTEKSIDKVRQMAKENHVKKAYLNFDELFQNVHYSYAMKNAIQPLKEIAFQVIDSNDEAGVTGKIKEILKGEL